MAFAEGGRVFGLDQWVESLGRGGSPGVVLAVAFLLGLRHASDPDHLVAVSTLVAGERGRLWRRASRLGLAWGLGHATTLVALGIPIVLFSRYLPAGLQRAAEALVGVVIVALALRLLRRWRAGGFHVHEHEHDGVVHRHLHAHRDAEGHRHAHAPRSSRAAYGVGVMHGVGGSAGVGLLLLASIESRAEAFAALALFAAAAAASMAILSLGAGYVLARPAARRLVPGLATAAVLFGVWYAVGAVA
jgi:ABC-type nickel/cobalt efflux system permease component RcnA